ncbi:MAG: DUF1553 domain-containing protein [Planctomycetes bacterium]|nr:DUF1553 domain-containing protein [Planctomycetota bacterium]
MAIRSRLTLTLSTAWIFLASFLASGPARGLEPAAAAAPALSIENAAGPGYTQLKGSDARRQLVVTARDGTGQPQDVTRKVSFEAAPAGVVHVDPSGLVTPLADGKAKVLAKTPDGLAGEVELSVESFSAPLPVSFPNQVVPIFTKHGCNAGGCHGKSSGQNGFKLSLLGFYPEEDHEYLVKEGRGRRISAAAPEQSLLLQKAMNVVPHGGGLRFEPGSYEHRLLSRWMLQGMPYGTGKEPKVASIEVVPEMRVMGREGEQQISVFARYTDGSIEDVTRMAQYEANDREMAEAGATGLVKTHDLAGEVAVMVRFQGQVGVFRASIPLGAKVESLPPARSFIDELVFKKLQLLGIPPSAPCDDATYLRRATIDIAGRLPAGAEAKAFAEDVDPAKREKLVDRLLASTDHADTFANKWGAILRNKKLNGNYTRGTYAFHDWIRESLHQNKPYDQFVREIIAASGEMGQNPPVAWYRSVKTVEQQVEDTAQLFLGLRIQCARCHHHPFERWSQDDYYGYAAFFSRVKRKNAPGNRADEQRVFHERGAAEARNPKNGQTLKPTGLGSAPLAVPPDQDPRLALADWLADPKNPFFAKSVANRYWKHFFSRGLVEPEDDMRVTNPPSNPELLDALADHFVKSGFNLKGLIREICRSSVYQLSAEPNEHNGRDKQNFSRFYPKRLPAEVLHDALVHATGTPTGFGGLPEGTRAIQLPDTNVQSYMLTVFGKPQGESACECERSQEASLAQSLYLLNSSEIQGKLSNGNGRAARLAQDAARPEEDKVRELYLELFSREPAAEDLAVATGHLKKVPEKKAAYEDILWALVNTKEFLFNH